MIDENPNGQPEFETPLNVKSMEKCKHEIYPDKEDYEFWGCPVCLSDDDLMDVTEDSQMLFSFKAYEQGDIWIAQVDAAHTAFNERTENGLLAIDMLIQELERIKKGEIVYPS